MTRTLLALSLVLYAAVSVSAETLDDAWRIATDVNNRLRAQGHLVEAAQADLQAAQAARNPVLSNQTAYTTLSNKPTMAMNMPAPMSALDIPIMDQSFAMSETSVSVPLYTGGKITALVDAGRYQVNAARANYITSYQDIQWEVTQAYFNVLRARQIHSVAQSAETSLLRHRRDVEKLLEQKIVTRNALLAAQTTWAASSQAVLMAENAVQVAEATYNRYMGRPLDSPVTLEEMDVPETSGDLQTLTDIAMRCRKELTQIASQSQASAAMSRASNAERRPKIVAMGGNTYLQNSYLKDESVWSGTIGLSWTPIDGGKSRAQARTAIQNAAASTRMYNETRSLIQLQVRSSWIAENETRSRIAVAELGKSQSDENLRVVTRQFQEGLVNHTEVLDAQTLQTAAAMNYCNAIYDAILATYRLRRAVGTGY